MAKLTSSAAKSLDLGIIVEHLSRLSIKAKEDREVNMASPEPRWANQIIKYLKNGELPKDMEEVRKVKVQAGRYLLLSDTLYKRSFTLLLLKCLFEEEADYVLQEIHEEIYENHSRGRAMAHKSIRQGIIGPQCKRCKSDRLKV